MGPGTVFSSAKCLDYSYPGHPERPERVKESLEQLRSKGFNIQEPTPALEKEVLQVHTAEHLESVRTGSFHDSDTPFFSNIFDLALLSAGSALLSYQSAMNGIPAFSLMRPPGHHSGLSQGVSGFCYFNNLAIAVREGLEHSDRIAILDVDVHHGNGTQEIFMNNKKVLFCSLHQVPLYPGSGLVSEKNCLNFPVPPSTDEKSYLQILDNAIAQINKFNPELIAVSAGFDTYKNDPLANLKLEIDTYRKIGLRVASLNRPRFAVLEGGYSEDLPFCIGSFLIGFFSSNSVAR